MDLCRPLPSPPLLAPGMVEMIPNAETLRKIQVEHGVTGSFKDRPLADWLQKHNPTEDEYEKVGVYRLYTSTYCLSMRV